MRGCVGRVDCPCADAARLGSRERAVPRGCVTAGSGGGARVFRHETVVETELVRPERGSDCAPSSGFVDLPGPEEVVLLKYQQFSIRKGEIGQRNVPASHPYYSTQPA